MASTYNNVGSVHYHLNNFNQALEYYTNSIKLYKKLDDKWGMTAGLVNIGLIYNEKSDYKKALFCYQEALNIYIEMGV